MRYRRALPEKPTRDARRQKLQRMMGIIGAGTAGLGALLDAPGLLVAGNAVAQSAEGASERDRAEHLQKMSAFYDTLRNVEDWNATLGVRQAEALYGQQLADKTRRLDREDKVAAENLAMESWLRRYGIQRVDQLEDILQQQGFQVENREDTQAHAIEMQRQGFAHSDAQQQRSFANAAYLQQLGKTLDEQGETFGGTPEQLDQYIQSLNTMLSEGIEEPDMTQAGGVRRRALTPKEMEDAIDALQKAYKLRRAGQRPGASGGATGGSTRGSAGGPATGSGNVFDLLDF